MGYSKQFKQQAMRLVTEKRYTPSRASRELGMPNQTFMVWLHTFSTAGSSESGDSGNGTGSGFVERHPALSKGSLSPPGIVAAARNRQHLAHHRHLKLLASLVDERKPHGFWLAKRPSLL